MLKAKNQAAKPKIMRLALVAGFAIVTISLLVARLGFAGIGAGADSAGVAPSGLGVFKATAKPEPLPDISFEDAKGNPVRLADFRGKVVLLNIWATWCGPCVEEMPSLAQTARRYASQGLVVVAVSEDRGGLDVVRSFFDKHSLSGLDIYIDKSTKLGSALHANGLPTTVMIGRDGKEIGRIEGGEDWTGAAAQKMLQGLLKGDPNAPEKT